jgi:ribosomal protein S18 acetylase RimI-like enzyme
MTFAIRRADPAEPADEQAMVRAGLIARASYIDGGHIPAEADYAGHLADAGARARDAELWLAVDEDGAVLGSVTFAVAGTPYAEVSAPGEGEFRMLTVDAAARGRGVGQALVQHCIARARELGLGALVLSSQPSMRDAHRIYERAGFVRTPELDWSPVPGVHLMTYRLAL